MSLEQYDPTPLDAAMSAFSKAVAASNTAEIATEAAETKLSLAQSELEEANASEAEIDLALSAAREVLITEVNSTLR